MEGGTFSKWGSRLGAADVRLKSLQPLHGWRAGGFQYGALALAPRTLVLKVCNSYTDGGRFLFKMGLSPETSLPFMILKLEISNSYKDGGRVVFKMGLSPDTSSPFMLLKLKMCNSSKDGGRLLFQMGLSP